jgi:hypothetical protein
MLQKLTNEEDQRLALSKFPFKTNKFHLIKIKGVKTGKNLKDSRFDEN